MRKIEKPKEREYPPSADIYIRLLPDDGLILRHLKERIRVASEIILSLPEEKLAYRYAPGKWTVKEVLAHVVDDERIYAYRALRFARNDETELPGFEQDAYAVHSGANRRTVESLLREFAAVRRATVALFDSFDDEALARSGVADGKRMTVRAFAYHIAGHELRHFNLIKERYL
ncbi:MAG: DinB family protein [Acidobacteriota bacterium]|nr:DinB family protein [Acidobacteriota bacterium]MDQ5836286.1 DinB family protein [Acidobacteriota bacterium]